MVARLACDMPEFGDPNTTISLCVALQVSRWICYSSRMRTNDKDMYIYIYTVYTYIHVHVHVIHVCVYIYTQILRYTHTCRAYKVDIMHIWRICMCTCIHIYIHIIDMCIYREREYVDMHAYSMRACMYIIYRSTHVSSTVDSCKHSCT